MSIRRISAHELSAMIAGRTPPLIIDVRTGSERTSFGWIDGSVNILPSDIPAFLQDTPPDRTMPLVLVCQTGARSAHAAQLFADAGYGSVHDLASGMLGWMLLRFPVLR